MPEESTEPQAHAEDTRARVLAAIRTSADALTLDQIAAALGVHRNTVRFHAGALEADGLVVAEPRPTGGKGRPRMAYAPTSAGVRSGARNYRMLADVLVAHLAQSSADPVPEARAAGRSWGEALAAERRRHPASPARLVREALTDIGFEPAAGPTTRPAEIELYNCPFRELVDDHQELVCALHSGLIEGLLGGAGHPEVAVDLRPFATPGNCLVRLTD